LTIVALTSCHNTEDGDLISLPGRLHFLTNPELCHNTLKVVLQGDLKSLKYIDDDAFKNLASMQSVIELIDLPSLVMVSNHAFRSCSGKLTIGGRLPALESIGHVVFLGTQDAVIDFSYAPSLRCIAYNAFTQMDDNSVSLRMDGAFPCLNLNPKDDRDDDRDDDNVELWNVVHALPPNTDGTATPPLGPFVHFDFGVQNCEVFESNAAEGLCHSINLAGEHVCTAPYLDDRLLIECSTYSGERKGAPNLPSCSLQIKDEQVMCIPISTAVSSALTECNAVDNREIHLCSNLTTVLTIGSRDDVTEIADFAFARFGGTLKMAGDFKSLTRIGSYAFRGRKEPTDMNFESTILFGRDSLPALVEIAPGAFQLFVGEVQFLGSPFPKLQLIGWAAFKGASAGERFPSCECSKLEFRGLESLVNVAAEAFADFSGTVKFEGSMPMLKTIGRDAFYNTSVQSVVDVFDLYSFETFGEGAFKKSDALLKISGPMPRFITIGKGAMQDTSNPQSSFNITCTVLVIQHNVFLLEHNVCIR
jgi:hypothetical protein